MWILTYFTNSDEDSRNYKYFTQRIELKSHFAIGVLTCFNLTLRTAPISNQFWHASVWVYIHGERERERERDRPQALCLIFFETPKNLHLCVALSIKESIQRIFVSFTLFRCIYYSNLLLQETAHNESRTFGIVVVWAVS